MELAIVSTIVGVIAQAGGGLETAGYCRTSRTRAAFANSLGQSLEAAFTEAALDGIARAAGSGTAPADEPKGTRWVAPEALLFASDRRGCRLEFSRGSVLRAAGEWGETLRGHDAFALVQFYHQRGARYFADVGDKSGPAGSARLALHEAIRRRYKILVDRPDVLLAALVEHGEPPDARQ